MDFTEQFCVIRLDFYFSYRYTQYGDVMFQNIENLKLLRIVHVTTAPYPVQMNRRDHVILLKIHGDSSYHFENQVLRVSEGNLVFVPKGFSYTATPESPSGEGLAIVFDAAIENAVPQVYSLEGYPDLKYLYDHLDQMWLFQNQADQYKCYSIFYNLLSFLSTKIAAQYAYQKKLYLISPATEYLQSHIFDCDFKINQLYEICGLSDTYFRKIFKENYGVTPQEYIINTRMNRALNYLSTKQFRSIREVSLAVGYKDTLYFSRLFSKIHGVPPSYYLL